MTDSSIPGAPMSYALIRYQRDPDRYGWLDLESFARATGTHPDLVVRLVALGLLDPERDRAGALWFAPDQLARLARMQR
ncbi:MerR family transcriptional regulator, partial [Amycolatopsis echigonensis]